MILQEKTIMLIDYQTFLMYNTNRRNLKMEIVNGMKIYRNVDEIKNILSDNRKIEQLNLHPIVKDLLLNADKQKLLANVNNHIAKISNHYFYVKNFCEQAGIPERGKSHDISKFSEEELFESIYFYEGTRSPIDKANEVIGWSPAFAHHIKYNDHQIKCDITLSLYNIYDNVSCEKYLMLYTYSVSNTHNNKVTISNPLYVLFLAVLKLLL